MVQGAQAGAARGDPAAHCNRQTHPNRRMGHMGRGGCQDAARGWGGGQHAPETGKGHPQSCNHGMGRMGGCGETAVPGHPPGGTLGVEGGCQRWGSEAQGVGTLPAGQRETVGQGWEGSVCILALATI